MSFRAQRGIFRIIQSIFENWLAGKKLIWKIKCDVRLGPSEAGLGMRNLPDLLQINLNNGVYPK
jgi:hypothetical protein